MNTTYKLLKMSLIGLIILLMSSLKTLEDKPNVLLIGDSISIGYTPFVQSILEEKAMVSRPMKPDGKAENCAGTTNGVLNIKRWIGDIKWDVIHFNFGLHDLKHVDPVTKKNSNKSSDPFQADLNQYEENLNVIIKELKSTNAELIFATTTPYPATANRPLRDPGMSAEYNKVALKVMKKHNITVNDLYSFVLPQMEALQRPNNVHFTESGSEELGAKVAESILAKLKTK